MVKRKKTDEILKRYLELNSKISADMKGGKNDIDIFKKFGEINEYLGVGSYILNAMLSGSIYGGIPNARSVEIAGAPQTGKTYLLLNIIRGSQEKGYFCYYIDTEGAVDESDLIAFGINPDYCQVIKTIKSYNNVKYFINTITKFKETDPELKIFIGLDSFGMLNTEASIANALAGKYAEDMGKRAKEGRELFRTITLDLSNLQIPFVFTNHTGANLNLFAQDPEVTSGGDGPTYAASIILMLGKKKINTDDDKKKYHTEAGIVVKAKTHKNRLAQPLEKYTVISFAHGMNPYIGLEDYLSWEICGVDKGTIYDAKQFEKKWKGKPPMNTTKKLLDTFDWKVGDDTFYFVRNKNAKTYGVKDTIMNVAPNRLFTNEIFTPNTLKGIDTYIQNEFRYKDFDEQMELQGLGEIAKLTAANATEEEKGTMDLTQ